MLSSIIINLLLLMSVLEISVLILSFQSSAASVGRVRERTKEQWDMVVLRRITDMEYNLNIRVEECRNASLFEICFSLKSYHVFSRNKLLLCQQVRDLSIAIRNS